MFVSMMNREKYGMRSVFLPGFPGLQKSFWILRSLCDKLLPELMAFMVPNGPLIFQSLMQQPERIDRRGEFLRHKVVHAALHRTVPIRCHNQDLGHHLDRRVRCHLFHSSWDSE